MGINDIQNIPTPSIDDNEIQIGGKKIGFNSQIRLNVKTAISIIGGLYIILTTIFTIFYFNLKNDISTNKNEEEVKRLQLYEKVEGKIDNLDDLVNELHIK